MKTIYFVRHGQTLLNQFRRMQGWVDSPLTKRGESQAAKVGDQLKDLQFNLAVSSDMMRAIHTLDIILKKISTLTTSNVKFTKMFAKFILVPSRASTVHRPGI